VPVGLERELVDAPLQREAARGEPALALAVLGDVEDRPAKLVRKSVLLSSGTNSGDGEPERRGVPQILELMLQTAARGRSAP
jgi:hypothetical protein